MCLCVDLELSLSKVGGELPSSLALLTKLEELYLYNSSFTGSINDIGHALINMKILVSCMMLDWLCLRIFLGTTHGCLFACRISALIVLVVQLTGYRR